VTLPGFAFAYSTTSFQVLNCDSAFEVMPKAEDGDRDLRDGVAVGLAGRRHGGGSDGAAAAGLVVDHDRLAEMLRGGLGDRPHGDVGRAAGRPGHDQGDRFRRIVLRQGRAAERQGGES
jgi:hypothetical protein